MRSLLFTLTLTAFLCFTLACEPTGGSPGAKGSPTAAYQQLYAAVKSKDTEKIKAVLSKKTHAFAEMVAGRQNQPVEKVYENGFTATTFAESLPEIRDERISGEFAAVEVWNSKDKRWEDLGFVMEDGAWKLAIGEMFGGSFKSPGKGRAIKEQEAANATSNTLVPGIPANSNMNMNMNMNMNANANANSNVKVIIPKERPQSNTK